MDEKNEKNEKLDYNIVRDMSKKILERLPDKEKVIGLIYINIHFFLIFLIGFIAVFNNNIYHLCVTLIIISFDALSVVILHGCPLTKLEQKYLKTDSSIERCELFKKRGIVYKCEHEYEKQIELLVNIWTIIAIKCLSIIFLKMFNLKLHDYNNIYK